MGPQSAADAYETLAYREKKRRESTTQHLPSPSEKRQDVEKYEQEMGTGDVDAEMFLKIERPRVRYDVEVVTKLIVYSGIAWWAVEGCPILFEILGLGLGVRAFEARR